MDSERFIALETHYNAMAATFATKADIEALRAEMHKMSAEGYRWMVASMIGMFLGFGGLYFAGNSSLKAQSVPAQPAQPAAPVAVQQPPPQPIVIYISPPPQK